MNNKNLVYCYQLFIILVSSVLFSGCGDLILTLPLKLSRLQSPEVSGKAFASKISVNAQTVANIRVIQDAGTIPPQQSPVEKDTSELKAGLDAGITLFPRLELFGSTSGGIYMAGLKYQLLGETTESSRKGNFSFALTAAYGASKIDNSGNVFGFDANLNSTTLHWNSSNDYHINDYAAIMGYRPADVILIYGGPFLSRYRIDGSFTQIYQGTSTETETPLKNRGNLYGANLGFSFSFPNIKKLLFTYEILYARLDWSRMDHTEGVFGNSFSLGYSF